MRKQDKKIAIIGGGISGLSASWFLKKKGYTNVTLFEKNNRVGGQAETFYYDESSYELGAFLGLSTQRETLSIMNELGIDDNKTMIEWLFYDTKGNQIFQLFDGQTQAFLNEYQHYKKIYIDYPEIEEFGFFNIPLTFEKPFYQWFGLNNYDNMGKVLSQYMALFGVSNLQKIPVFYILQVLNYKTLRDLLKIEITPVLTWGGGLNVFTSKLSFQVPHLKLSSPVTEVKRNFDGIYIKTPYETDRFDEVIITTNLKDSLEFLDADDEEFNLFNLIQTKSMASYLFRVKATTIKSGIIRENLFPNRNGHVFAWWKQNPKTTNSFQIICVYAMDISSMSQKEKVDIVISDLAMIGFTEIDFFTYRHWDVLPHVVTEDILDNFYNRLYSLQGNHGTYYSGEILSGITIEKGIQFSKWLIEKYF
ncbi:FAD-dependent oxidoreductase [Fundicoccus culcitae]|uniref:FAD-dependent oxidoreductase n=1 Tax=Fundicoccus culcitae TaxID=2969821 RepID=A0ABY5P7Z3_9LACT|nr:FAD-dependent oxidoreductase [Fundicoccus culcitae]UUX34705.1 FAD-dependent oxidoreductase [Fundicoccus culcitae]